jgi:hypothetical protein
MTGHTPRQRRLKEGDTKKDRYSYGKQSTTTEQAENDDYDSSSSSSSKQNKRDLSHRTKEEEKRAIPRMIQIFRSDTDTHVKHWS